MLANHEPHPCGPYGSSLRSPGSSQHQAMPAMPALHTADPPFLSSFGRPVAFAPYLRPALHRKGQAATSKRGSGQVHIMGRWSINLLVTRCFPTVQFAQNRMLSRSLDCTSSGPSFHRKSTGSQLIMLYILSSPKIYP